MITKEKFMSYENIRQSGVTNMCNVTLVSDLTGLERIDILEIMKNYGELKKKFKN